MANALGRGGKDTAFERGTELLPMEPLERPAHGAGHEVVEALADPPSAGPDGTGDLVGPRSRQHLDVVRPDGAPLGEEHHGELFSGGVLARSQPGVGIGTGLQRRLHVEHDAPCHGLAPP